MISGARQAVVLIDGPDTAIELAFLFSHFVQHYVRKNGNTPEVQLEVLGALESVKAAVLHIPGKLGPSN